MKSLVSLFNGNKIGIEKVADDHYMFDISVVSKFYGKKFYDFERTTVFKEYLKKSAGLYSLKKTELIFKSGHLVKVHQSIFVEFMRWVDSDFSVKANKIVFDVMLGKINSEKKKVNKLTKQLAFATSGFVNKNGEMAVRTFIKKHPLLKLNEKDVHDELISAGWEERHVVTTVKRKLLDASVGSQKKGRTIMYKEAELIKMFSPFGTISLSKAKKSAGK